MLLFGFFNYRHNFHFRELEFGKRISKVLKILFSLKFNFQLLEYKSNLILVIKLFVLKY